MGDFGGVGVERGHSVRDFQEIREVKPGAGRVGRKIPNPAGIQRGNPLGSSCGAVETPEILWKKKTPAALGLDLEEQNDLGLLEAFPRILLIPSHKLAGGAVHPVPRGAGKGIPVTFPGGSVLCNPCKLQLSPALSLLVSEFWRG